MKASVQAKSAKGLGFWLYLWKHFWSLPKRVKAKGIEAMIYWVLRYKRNPLFNILTGRNSPLALYTGNVLRLTEWREVAKKNVYEKNVASPPPLFSPQIPVD